MKAKVQRILTLDLQHCRGLLLWRNKLAMLEQLLKDIFVKCDPFQGNQTNKLTTDQIAVVVSHLFGINSKWRLMISNCLFAIITIKQKYSFSLNSK